MSELPNGWELKTFNKLFHHLQYGLTAKAAHDDAGIRFLRITDIADDGTIDWDSVPSCVEPNDEIGRYTLADGDFVFARSGSIEKAARVEAPPNAVFASYLIRGTPIEGERSDWLAWFIRSPLYLDQVRAAAAGIGLSNINATKLAAFVVPIPPIAGQRRIVSKLDSLFGRSKSARAELVRIPPLLERYKRAIISDAFSEYATDKTLLDVCDSRRGITYGVIKLGDDVRDGIPCLRTSNVRWLRIETDGMKRISRSLSMEYSRTVLQGGEVLVNVRGTLGGVAVATPEMKGWNVSREVAVVPVKTEQVDPDFIAYWIGSDISQRWLNRMEKGVAYTGINLQDLRRLPISMPSINEQKATVRRIRNDLAKADALGEETARATRLIHRLDEATLAKAFRGELIAPESQCTEVQLKVAKR